MNNLLNKRIPSLLGIFALVVGVGVTTFLVKGGELYQTYAGPGDEPKNIQISNITDSSYTVTYSTDSSVIGTVKSGVSPDSMNQTFLDDRDKNTQDVGDYKAHYITVDNLSPNTTYFFTINSGNNTANNNGDPFTVKTGPVLNINSFEQKNITGKAINPDGAPTSDGVVIIEINGAQKISSYLDKNGIYNIPVNKLRTHSLDNYYKIEENSAINIKVDSSDYTSSVNVDGSNYSLVPIITLSNNYDFTEDNSETSSSTGEEVSFPEFNSRPRNNVRQTTTRSPSSNPSP